MRDAECGNQEIRNQESEGLIWNGWNSGTIVMEWRDDLRVVRLAHYLTCDHQSGRDGARPSVSELIMERGGSTPLTTARLDGLPSIEMRANESSLVAQSGVKPPHSISTFCARCVRQTRRAIATIYGRQIVSSRAFFAV
jgi:hypothetical protein